MFMMMIIITLIMIPEKMMTIITMIMMTKI